LDKTKAPGAPIQGTSQPIKILQKLVNQLNVAEFYAQTTMNDDVGLD
jgi:hypothetical protein